MNREPIYQAVFAFWQGLTVGGAPAFVTATRYARHWDNVGSEEQPALYQMQASESANYRKGLPTIWTLNIKLLIYVRTNAQSLAPGVTPSSIFNPLVDAIEAALVVDDPFNNACTLGGLVSHCAIGGDIEIYEGNLGDEAVVIVPVKILTSP